MDSYWRPWIQYYKVLIYLILEYTAGRWKGNTQGASRFARNVLVRVTANAVMFVIVWFEIWCVVIVDCSSWSSSSSTPSSNSSRWCVQLLDTLSNSREIQLSAYAYLSTWWIGKLTFGCRSHSPPKKSRFKRRRTPSLSATRSLRANLSSALPTSSPRSTIPSFTSPICPARRPSPASLVRSPTI